MHAFSIIECMPGYTGVNCSFLCPYPYYEKNCQRTCNCSRDLCNVSTGCIVGLIGNHFLICSMNPIKKMYLFDFYFDIKNDGQFLNRIYT